MESYYIKLFVNFMRNFRASPDINVSKKSNNLIEIFKNAIIEEYPEKIEIDELFDVYVRRYARSLRRKVDFIKISNVRYISEYTNFRQFDFVDNVRNCTGVRIYCGRIYPDIIPIKLIGWVGKIILEGNNVLFDGYIQISDIIGNNVYYIANSREQFMWFQTMNLKRLPRNIMNLIYVYYLNTYIVSDGLMQMSHYQKSKYV
jgi:hypothetical protein